jgi:hypothetical protein
MPAAAVPPIRLREEAPLPQILITLGDAIPASGVPEQAEIGFAV